MIFKRIDFYSPIDSKSFNSVFLNFKLLFLNLDFLFNSKPYGNLFFNKTIKKKYLSLKIKFNNNFMFKKLINDNSYLKLFFKKYHISFFNSFKQSKYNYLDLKRRNIYSYYKLKLIYSWNIIWFLGIERNFKLNSGLFSSFRIWSPFIYAFFYIKSTKKNHFFFFGLLKEFLNFKYFYTSILKFTRLKYNKGFVNLGKLNRLYTIKYKIDYFKSAGIFKLKKKLKRSNQIKEFLYKYMLTSYNSFSVLNKFDFFFFHIKGLFRHVSFVTDTFSKAIFFNNFEYINNVKKKIKRSYNSFIKISKLQSLPVKRLVLTIKSFIKTARFFLKKLNSNIENESFLVGNIKTGLIYNFPIFKLNKFLKYPYFILSIKTSKLFKTINSKLFNKIEKNLKSNIHRKLRKNKSYSIRKKKFKQKIDFRLLDICFSKINDFFIRQKYVSYKFFIYQLIIGSTVDLKYIISFFKVKRITARLFKYLYKKPRGVYLMDYTSYAFNGCRRVRHYKRY